MKRYEYKPKDARAPLLAVMRVTLPLLLGMCHQLVGDDSAEAGQVRSNTFHQYIHPYLHLCAPVFAQVVSSVFYKVT